MNTLGINRRPEVRCVWVCIVNLLMEIFIIGELHREVRKQCFLDQRGHRDETGEPPTWTSLN